MLIRLINFIGIILCDNEQLIEDDTFIIAVDRPIEKLAGEDELLSKGIHFYKNDDWDETFDNYIWDRYFPKPYFYEINLENLQSLSTNFTGDLKFLASDDKVMFSFKIAYNNSQLVISDFHDANNARIDVTKQDDLFCDFILSRQETNIESIKNSLEYGKKIEALTEFIEKNENLVSNIPGGVSEIDLNEEIFSNSLKSKFWEMKIAMFEILNSLFKAGRTIITPSSIKLRNCKPFDHFRKKIGEVILKLKNLKALSKDEIELSNLTDKEEQLKRVNDNFVFAIKVFEYLTSNVIEDFYNKLFGHFESLDRFTKNVIDNGKQNTEITLECDTRKVDTFVNIFSPLLLEYCELLDDCNELDSLSYDVSFTDDTDFMFQFDLVAARELKKYLSSYSKDKTDFLIFSQSDYFADELASRIGSVCNFIIQAVDFKKRNLDKINGNQTSLSEDDLKYLSRVEEFQKKWKTMIDQYGDGKNSQFGIILKKLVPVTVQNNADVEQDTKSNNKSYSTLLYFSLSVAGVGLVGIAIYLIFSDQSK